MEYLNGEDLRDYMNRQGKVKTGFALDIFDSICNALDFAHRRGIVHRDIKPSNIILTDDEKIKVADFGIAKLLRFETITEAGNVVGTPFYMSPEQIEGKKLDGRSDLFSAGIVLYEMLTGQHPFRADSIPAVAYKIIHHKEKTIRELEPEVSPGCAEMIAKILAKTPGERYDNAADVRAALIRCRGNV
jgi:serine/threonine-protein kinase